MIDKNNKKISSFDNKRAGGWVQKGPGNFSGAKKPHNDYEPWLNTDSLNEDLRLLFLKTRFKEVISEFDRLKSGVFLLATNGEVICSNSFAVQTLLDKDGLKTDIKNRLSSSDLVDNLRLQRAIAKVINGVGKVPKRNIEVKRLSKPSSYILDFLPIFQGDIPVGIITIVIDYEKRYEIDPAYITSLFESTSFERSDFSFERSVHA